MHARFSWVVLTVVSVAVGWGWRTAPGGGEGVPAPSAEELAEAAGVSPTTLVVDFSDDISPEALATNAYIEEPISRFSKQDRLYRVRFESADQAAQAMAELRRDPSVESVDYDVPATLFPEDNFALAAPGMSAECAPTGGGSALHSGFPDDPCFRYQWHLGQVGLPAAWKLGQGKGAVVAVVDTGVSQVPDLKATRFVPGYNFVHDSERADDDHGHGTHVAGTIAQATNNKLGVGGVAWDASIMPLKVLSAQGSGSMAAIAQAIRYAADNGAHVINMSLGGPFPVTAIRSAVEYANKKGVTVVAAAGNDGRGRVSYPARYPGVIAVASTQFDETTTFYSNWGKEIDIAGPGGNVRVDQNGDGKPDGVLQNTVVPGNISRTDYLWFMGTSMASPHVAGVAALIVGAGVTRPAAVESMLVDTARKPKSTAAKRVSDRYGAGIVDAGAALKKARLGRGAGSLGLAASIAFIGLGALRRRGNLGARPGVGFFAAGILGASGLFFLPWLGLAAAGIPFVTSGGLEGLAASMGAAAHGNPILWSAFLPFLAVVLLSGVRRLRPTLAGLAFGIAGALWFAALAYVADVRFVPDFLDRAWLAGNAAIAALLGLLVLRR